MTREFTCPVTRTILNTPCNLTECKFWLNVDWAKNCLLSYVNSQDTERLSHEEIAFLYGISLDKVNEISDAAMVQIKSGIINAESFNNPNLDRQFWFIKTNKVCCVCNSTIIENERIEIPDIGLAYCGTECQQEIHPLLIKLEFKTGLPTHNILAWAANKFKNLLMIEKALGLPKWLIRDSCVKYLGRTIS